MSLQDQYRLRPWCRLSEPSTKLIVLSYLAHLSQAATSHSGSRLPGKLTSSGARDGSTPSINSCCVNGASSWAVWPLFMRKRLAHELSQGLEEAHDALEDRISVDLLVRHQGRHFAH